MSGPEPYPESHAMIRRRSARGVFWTFLALLPLGIYACVRAYLAGDGILQAVLACGLVVWCLGMLITAPVMLCGLVVGLVNDLLWKHARVNLVCQHLVCYGAIMAVVLFTLGAGAAAVIDPGPE